MTRRPVLYLSCSLLAAVVFIASLAPPAEAQYRPLPSSGYGTGSGPKGEPYHVEAAFNLWSPTPDFVISSESLGIPGTDIDVQADLAIEQAQKFEFRLVLRPAKKHKFRFHYLPLTYDATTTLKGTIIFNGIKFPVSTQVESSLAWKTYRIGYEYDIISRPQGFFGIVLEAKYTDARIEIRSPFGVEFARARAPIPALGAIGRVYIARLASITAEFTGFALPSSINENYQAHYYDWDFYGTVNVTNNVGAQLGYRSLDLGYVAKKDRGDARLTGIYFGGVVRF
jgi:hypothetical protein